MHHPALSRLATPLLRPRSLVALLLAALALAYLAQALALWGLTPLGGSGQALDGRPWLASGSDVVAVTVSADAPPQQRPLLLAWTQGGQRLQTMQLLALVDARARTILVPVGAHPGWRGEVSAVRLVGPYPDEQPLRAGQMRAVRGSPLAVELPLLAALAPLLPTLPPYEHAQLFVAALLGVGLALALPWSHWRGRLALLAAVFAGAAALWAVVAQATLLASVGAAYSRLDDRGAAAVAPGYEARPSAIAQLVAAAEGLPAGPVLLLDHSPASDLLTRARYLLYPRRVDVRSPQDAPSAIPRLLAEGYVAAIQSSPTAEPPAPGWEPVVTAQGTLGIWRAPGVPPLKPRPVATWPTAALPLLGAVALVGAAGWAVATALGWRGMLRSGAAWPIGAALLAWWMWLLEIAGLPWSAWSVGGPPLVAAVVAGWYGRQRRKAIGREEGLVGEGQTAGGPRPWLSRGATGARSAWAVVGWGAIGLLVACVLAQALLLPLTDRDSWAMWGLKGQAFFLDRSLAPVLTMYRGADVHHASYPPAQPLVQAWLFLAMGGVSERLVKVVFPLWYLSGILLSLWACRRWSSPPVALAWALLLATTPLYLDHGTLANADLPLGVAMLLGGLGLACWVETGEARWVMVGAVALAGAAWIKLDGIYLGAGMLLAALLVGLVAHRGDRTRRRQVLSHGILAGGLFFALVVPWLVYARLLGLDDMPALGAAQHERWALLREGAAVIGAEVLFSYNNSSKGLLGGGYGLFWLICLGALVMGWRRLRDDAVLRLLLLIVAGGFAFYLAVYAVRPYASVERYLLHLAPLALLAAARAASGAFEQALRLSQAASPVVAPSTRGRRTQKGRKSKGRHA